MFKPQLVKQGGQTKIVHRPVALTLALTPKQKQVVLPCTGRVIEQIDLTKEYLQNFSLNFSTVPKDNVEYDDNGSLSAPINHNYDLSKAKDK